MKVKISELICFLLNVSNKNIVPHYSIVNKKNGTKKNPGYFLKRTNYLIIVAIVTYK